MNLKSVDVERIRELFEYDSETGVFTRKVSNRRWKAGTVAGSRDKDGYTLINIDGVQYRAHRLAWAYTTGDWPEEDVDHINGVRSDNRIANLRAVARKTNVQNSHRAKSTSASGLQGAFRHKRSGLWRSAVRVDGREISLGYYKTPEEAHAAYLVGKRKYHEGFSG